MKGAMDRNEWMIVKRVGGSMNHGHWELGERNANVKVLWGTAGWWPFGHLNHWR